MIMKKYNLFVWLVALFFTYCPQPSIANNDNRMITGVHAIGNEALCVYGKGVDVLQFFGLPYSSPSLLDMQLTHNDYRIESTRIPQTAVWEHRIIGDSDQEVQLTDFISNAGYSFVRRIVSQFPVRFRINICTEYCYIPYAQDITIQAEDLPTYGNREVSSSYRVSIPSGVPFYGTYSSPQGHEYQIITTGAIKPSNRIQAIRGN